MPPESKKLRYVFLRQKGQMEETVSTKTLVQRIRDGQLAPDDEISAEGKNWVRLMQHSQLAPFFEPAQGQPGKEEVEDPTGGESLPPGPSEDGRAHEAHEAEQPEEIAAALVADSAADAAPEKDAAAAAQGTEEASKGQRVFLLALVGVLFLILGYNLLTKEKPADDAAKKAAPPAAGQEAGAQQAAGPAVEAVPEAGAAAEAGAAQEETEEAAQGETPPPAGEEEPPSAAASADPAPVEPSPAGDEKPGSTT